MTKPKPKAENHSALLTPEYVASLPPAADRYLVHDTELKGFRLVVRKSKKLFVLQTEIKINGERQAIYKRLGDSTYVRATEARSRAHEEIAKAERVADRSPDAPYAGKTFGEAWCTEFPGNKSIGYLPRLTLRGRSPKTIKLYTQQWDDYLKPQFGHVAIRDIDRAAVRAFHTRLTQEVGSYAANAVCKLGRAISNWAQRELKGVEINGNPWHPADLHNPEHARETGMAAADLAPWFGKLLAVVPNPIHREFWMMALFTGLRRSDLLTMERRNVQADRILIPHPKGGIAKAFAIPITPPMSRSLERLTRLANGSPWVFPLTRHAAKSEGHLVDIKNPKLGTSPHALRHTFRGMAFAAQVPELMSKMLMGHSLPHDIHSQYLTVASHFVELKAASETVSAYIMQHLPADAEARLSAKLLTNAEAVKRFTDPQPWFDPTPPA
jgi:integrase